MTYPDPKMLIGGEWLGHQGRQNSPIVNPSTEEELGRVPHASQDDLAFALRSASESFKTWKRRSSMERSDVLRKAASKVRDRNEFIASILTLEQGKTQSEARAEVISAAEVIEWFAEEGRRRDGAILPGRFEDQLQTVSYEPIGPCALFSPWNFPAVTSMKKVAAALAAGCTCILKPAEETPATVVELARAFHESGLPPGALNIVFGVPFEISEYLIQSPIVKKISLTGSTAVGRELARLAALGPKPATLELGGHAPAIVGRDVDAKTVAELSAAAKYRNAGQICLSPTRFLIHAEIFDEFVGHFAAYANSIKVGDGFDDQSQMGPLANDRRLFAIAELVDDATKLGANLVSGGARIGNKGNFFAPTVLSDVPQSARIMNEEPFGPVAVLNRFTELDDALSEANRLPYGLAAYVFSDSDGWIRKAADGIEAGAIGVNHFGTSYPETPFGGIGASGYGAEGGKEGLRAYLVPKFVSHRTLEPGVVG